jgi:putative membrane protein
MKNRLEICLAGLLSGLLALPIVLAGSAAAADADGNSTMDSVKEGAGNAATKVKDGASSAATTVKDGAVSAGHAVSNGTSKAVESVKEKVSGEAKATLPDPDRTFAKKAAIAGMFEVEAAKVAKEKAASPDVKSFAEKMITDHTKANEELKDIAKQKNVDLPTEVDAEHQAKLDALAKLSGSGFDKLYAQQQAKGHDMVLAMMRSEAKNGRDPDLKAFAKKYDSVIAEHDRMAKKTSREVKSEKTGG